MEEEGTRGEGGEGGEPLVNGLKFECPNLNFNSSNFNMLINFVF